MCYIVMRPISVAYKPFLYAFGEISLQVGFNLSPNIAKEVFNDNSIHRKTAQEFPKVTYKTGVTKIQQSIAEVLHQAFYAALENLRFKPFLTSRQTSAKKEFNDNSLHCSGISKRDTENCHSKNTVT